MPALSVDRTRRVDWKTMALKLRDAVVGLLRNPDGKGEREWAEKMLFRVHEMLENEAATPPIGEEKP